MKISERINKLDTPIKKTLDVLLYGAGVSNIGKAIAELEAEAEGLADKLSKTQIKLASKTYSPLQINIDPAAASVHSPANFPNGKMSNVKASCLFPGHDLPFEVPHFEWEHEHPLVPDEDKSYQFNAAHLKSILYCLVYNVPAWLVGHTGTGKTTHALQILARLKWPVVRANFDSELTRMEVIGKETLTTDGDGHSVTKFTETILPMAMREGYVFLGDEWDCIRPDVAYVFQPVLEGGDLVVMEDGARIVERHPMFRIIATGNTKGQGDESGLYNGTRPQSGASMDRFPVFIEFDYMTKSEVRRLLKKKYSDVDENVISGVTSYSHEYWRAFSQTEVSTPLTLRGLDNILNMYRFMRSSGMEHADAMKLSVKNTCISKANQVEAEVINGISDRTLISGGVS